MNLPRIKSLWWLTTLVPYGFATIALEAMQAYPQLSVLQSYINSSSNFSSLLSTANNFTFLAPSNDTFANFATQFSNGTDKDLLEATLQYSLLTSGFPTLSFSDTPQFIASNLVNSTYMDVTGGQRVELVLGSDGTPQVVTRNKSLSTSTSTDIVCVWGIIHIINEVVSVPLSGLLEITAAGLEFFISILNDNGFLNSTATYVAESIQIPDVTFFIPNSAAALANATAVLKNSSLADQQLLFEYHMVIGLVAYSPLLTNGLQLRTAAGSNITVTIRDGDTYVNSAKIIASDYIIANGVIHVLDNFLNLSDTSPPPLPASSTVASSTTPASSSSPTSSSSATATVAKSTKSNSLSSGEKAGIGVGAAVGGIIILAALVWFLLSKRKGDAMPWDAQGMTAAQRYYVQRGTVQKQQEDLGLGLQSTGMHKVTSVPEDQNFKVVSSFGSSTATAGNRPSVPPRSPTRVASGNEFF